MYEETGVHQVLAQQWDYDPSDESEVVEVSVILTDTK